MMEMLKKEVNAEIQEKMLDANQRMLFFVNANKLNVCLFSFDFQTDEYRHDWTNDE